MRVDGNPNEAGHTVTTGVPISTRPEISHETVRVVGNGSFGVVFQATQLETGDTVAIKKVLQDKRFKNRELQIMKMMDHVNVVRLKHCFYSTNDAREVYLNLVLEFVPDTVHRIGKHYSKSAQRVPSLYVKLYTYQMARVGEHPQKRRVPPRHQTAESAGGHDDAPTEAVRFRIGQGFKAGPTQHLVHLFAGTTARPS